MAVFIVVNKQHFHHGKYWFLSFYKAALYFSSFCIFFSHICATSSTVVNILI